MRRRALVATQTRSDGTVADEANHEEEDPDDEEEENLTAGRSGARRRGASTRGRAELRSRRRTMVGPDGEALEARCPGGVRRPGERVVGSSMAGMGVRSLTLSFYLPLGVVAEIWGFVMAMAPTGVAGMARRDPVATDQPGRCRRTRTDTHTVLGTAEDKFARPSVERGCPICAWLNCPMLRRTRRRHAVVSGDAGVWTALETGRGGVRYTLLAVGVVDGCCGLDVESRGRIWCRKDRRIVYCDVMMG
ncbi:glycine-rich cell wall structural protein-like [Iris pallida]|uniref:Glycine-rich cell wall structural protein-like n=1 Tax=Iris pallida TaxID=29817 RepID=A0AAX6ICM8_IRIPA|nr:glycine-rich cell wall structural protein-like [Iris pallida]